LGAFPLRRKWRIARAGGRLESLKARKAKELGRASKALARALADVDASTTAAVEKLRKPIAPLLKAKAAFEATVQARLAKEDKRLDAAAAAIRKEAGKKVEKIEGKLAALLKPKAESDVARFTVYRDALADGWREGSRPSSEEAQAMMRNA
jgi:protein subunit release factor A